MADPTTLNVLLAVPTHGSDVDTWDQPLNSNSSAIDGFFGGVQTISVSSSPITLTSPSGSVTPSGGPTQSQNAVLRFTGTLTANVTITLPLPSYYIVENLTTGNFVVILRAAGSGQVIGIRQGGAQHVYCDGTNVRFVNLPDVGTYWDYAGASVPAWVTACTVPPYLNCDASTFSGTTYPYLASVLGRTTLPDCRGGGRATLNQGTGRITTAGSGIDGNTRFSRGGTETVLLDVTIIPSHKHNLNDPGHSHSVDRALNNGNFYLTGSGTPTFNINTGTSTGSSTTGITMDNTGGGGVHQNMPPTTISGITMIRAA